MQMGDASKRSPPSRFSSYAFAAAVTAAGLLLRLALDRYLAGVQFITLFPAILISAYFWGTRPALLSALLGGLAAWFLFIAPQFSFVIRDPVQAFTLAIYFLVGCAIAVGSGGAFEARASVAASERRLRQVLDSMREGFVLLDRDMTVLDINAEGLRLEQRPRSEIVGKTHWQAWPGSEDSELGRLYKKAMSEHMPVSLDHRFAWPHRELAWLEMRAYPSEDGLAVFYRDVTERKRAQAALIETDRRLNAVLDNASVAIFVMDERQQCSYMNAAAEKLTGYTLAETQGRPLHDVIHHTRPDGSPFPLEECAIDRAFPENNQQQGEEVFVHRDGHFYPVAFTASPIRDDQSRTIGTIIEVRDISAEKQAEQHQQLLINELNHRVKNTLAVVQSIAARTFRGDGADPKARRAFEGRLVALSGAHDILTRENWEAASLRQIVEETAGLGCGADTARVDAEGPDLRIAPQTAVSLAMALHELCTNAVKYGALSNDAGRVTIRWSIGEGEEGARLHFNWRESGGPPVPPSPERGFGTTMIERGLAHELGGRAKIEFAPEGLVCSLDAPLPQADAN